MKKALSILLIMVITLMLCVGCESEANRVSYNVSKEADNFNVCREIVVLNVRDDTVLYTLRGYFSLKDEGHNELCIISEVGDGIYKKDFIYLSEWTTYVCTDLDQVKNQLKKETGYFKTMWCGDPACEAKMKELGGLKSRCIPFSDQQEHLSDTCVCCGKKAKEMIVWGNQY